MSEPELLKDSRAFQAMEGYFGTKLKREKEMPDTILTISQAKQAPPGTGPVAVTGTLVKVSPPVQRQGKSGPYWTQKIRIQAGNDWISASVFVMPDSPFYDAQCGAMHVTVEDAQVCEYQNHKYLQGKVKSANAPVAPPAPPQSAPAHPASTNNGDRQYWDNVRAMERRGYAAKDAAHMICVKSLLANDDALLTSENVIAEAKELLHWIETGDNSPRWPLDDAPSPTDEDIPF